MSKRFLSLLFCFVFIVSAASIPAWATDRDTSFEETLAADLKTLGIFQGFTDTDFGLDQKPTRVQAMVILVRILGAEEQALTGRYHHPFTDVPEWASGYIGYAYTTGITNGTSATTFGTGDASASMFLSFMLRILGYSDTNGEDFTVSNPFTLAESIGILPDCVDTDSFLRADIVSICYAALGTPLKNSTQTLADKLIAGGVFTQETFDSCYDTDAFDSISSQIEQYSRKEQAYSALEGWIEKHNINLLDKYPYYQEKIQTSEDKVEYFSFTVVKDDNRIMVGHEYTINGQSGSTTVTTLNISLEQNVHLVTFYFQLIPHDWNNPNEIDERGYIFAPTFSEDSVFEFSEYTCVYPTTPETANLRTGCESTAKKSCLQLLKYIDTLFMTQIPNDYTIADLGFTQLA